MHFTTLLLTLPLFLNQAFSSPLEQSREIHPSCGVPGYDCGKYVVSKRKCRLQECAAYCTQNPKCRSYGYEQSNGICRLYSEPVNKHIQRKSSSPYTFYDKACKFTGTKTTTTTTKSASKLKTSCTTSTHKKTAITTTSAAKTSISKSSSMTTSSSTASTSSSTTSTSSTSTTTSGPACASSTGFYLTANDQYLYLPQEQEAAQNGPQEPDVAQALQVQDYSPAFFHLDSQCRLVSPQTGFPGQVNLDIDGPSYIDFGLNPGDNWVPGVCDLVQAIGQMNGVMELSCMFDVSNNGFGINSDNFIFAGHGSADEDSTSPIDPVQLLVHYHYDV